ncbi:(2Fe-2S)-binding protein [Hymenobacter sediminis]|uniref:2Fe-2S iron-sulfur cluster-binding protein n=1 Tax=Hymenobacter sediminis TaxID=2218621 RepID=UPI000DA647FE|nr:2Fe-2S iron-sulfur cluster-binding protein [Hymenobacter sediminis]RPD47193.1 (2Fe-2S)-binding protein [Hymenobacter sediminis]
MPTLLVQNLLGEAISVPAGVTLLAAVQAAGHDWLHACGARGRCTTCRLQVLRGLELLTPPTEAELRYRAAGHLLPTERLTCQARLLEGEVIGCVPDATKLPHVTYQG